MTESDKKFIDIFSNMWQLSYRHGMNATMVKNFYFKGSLLEAQARARKHCDVMKYKYCGVTALVNDIDAEEYLHLHGMTREQRAQLDRVSNEVLKAS